MSVYLLWQVIVCLIFGGVFGWTIFSRYDAEVGSESAKDAESDLWGRPKQRYYPHIPGTLLPIMILTVFFLDLLFFDLLTAVEAVISMCFSIFLHICIYYLILLPLLPYLRRHISARTCATLWLLPNYLYITQLSYMELNRPLWVIHISGNWLWVIAAIWLTGFVCVLLWKIIDHLIFRRNILANEIPVTDTQILNIWDDVIEKAHIRKPRFRLVTSPHVSAPLSVGLFRRATRVILPQKPYTPEELELILQHEIIHIGREDAWGKFFIVFCTATCWFNPLMWIAMKKSAEDTELSCDESVLLEADDAGRKKYAALLLDTAQNERGFTTCLSASAEAMRYRLKSITNPTKRHTGALLVGLIFAILAFTCGYVTLSYGEISGYNAIYQGTDTATFSLEVYSLNDDTDSTYRVLDEDALHAYLSELKLSKIVGHYSLSEDSKADLILRSPDSYVFVHLYDDVLRVQPLYHTDREQKIYYINDRIDWDYLHSFILANDPLGVRLTCGEHSVDHILSASPEQLWKVENGQKILIYDSGRSEYDYSRIGSNAFENMTFTFPYPLADPCTIHLGSMRHTVTPQDALPEYTVKAPESSALCTVTARYQYPSGDIYEAYYCFLVEYIYS